MTVATCTRCAAVKPLSDFSPRRDKVNGRQSRCRACCTELQREWSRAHRAVTVQRQRRYRRDNPAPSRERAKRHYQDNLVAERAKRRAWEDANREKKNAHGVVYRAVKAGRLVRPDACERCGATKFAIHAHHEDYSRPLEVAWLCAPCHKDTHAEAVA